MIFVDIPFPERIALGAQSDTNWSTNIIMTGSGFTSTNQNWLDCQQSFDVSFSIRTVSDYKALKVHFHSMRGKAKSFPFKDFLDFQVSQSEGVIQLSDATSDAILRLYKQYGTGDDAYYRKITRPTIVFVFRTRASVTTDATADATVDMTTGEVTMTGDVDGDVYTWAGEYVVPCRYDTDKLPAVVINKESGVDGELYVQCDSISVVEVRE